MTIHPIGRCFRSGVLAIAVAGTAAGDALAGIFYQYEVAVRSGQNGFTGFGDRPSINNKGAIAFVGQKSSGENLYVWHGSGQQPIPLVAPQANASYGRAAQINDGGAVIGRRFVSPTSTVRVWAGDGSGEIREVARGAFPSTQLYSAVQPYAAINNDGDAVFYARPYASNPTDTWLVTSAVNSPSYPDHTLSFPGNLIFFPMLSDRTTDSSGFASAGFVVLRAGNFASDPIRLYAFDLSSAQFITGGATGLSQAGQKPGISEDGKVVAFYAVDAHGPGIFISVDDGSGSRIPVRIAGNAGELGTDSAGNPISFATATFDPDSRVGVVHQSIGPPGLVGDCITVCFVATPTAASPEGLFSQRTGVWTARGRVRLSATPGVVYDFPVTNFMPVAQLGDADVIPGEPLTALSVFDPLALPVTDNGGNPRGSRFGEHRIAFHATTAAGQAIVRATYFDSDEDSLPDHWETSGVTIGGQFIDLPTMGANPLHKDVFVHADWMEPGPIFRPSNAAINIVTEAFDAAPVANPDGTMGIHLHVDSGAASIMDPVTGARWGRALSKSGAIPNAPLIGSFVGSVYQWNDVDAYKLSWFAPARRSPIFHYALFGTDFHPNHKSGISRGIPGSDFLVTLGGFTTPGGTRLQTAGTFFHELGHNLGLRHGGGDDVNRKPNYLSIMNYAFQMVGLIKSNGTSEFNYSVSALPDLIESTLDESLGIADPDGHFTLWSAGAGPNSCTGNPAYNKALPAPALDWNCDGALTGGLVARDINGDTVLSPLKGFEDWSAVVFDGGGRIGSSAGATEETEPPGTIPDEPTLNEILEAVPAELFYREDFFPVDEATVTPAFGEPPLQVKFDGTLSSDPDGAIVSWVWDFGDGSTVDGAIVEHTFTTEGIYLVRLLVTDDAGNENLVPMVHRVVVSAGVVCAGINPTGQAFNSSGGSDIITVNADDGCAWTAVSNDGFITIDSGASGSGDGTVNYTVAANSSGLSRSGTITVAGQTFTVDQDGVVPTLVLTCPSDLSVSNDADECSAVVSYPPPVASGGVSPYTIVCSPLSGSIFQVGATTVNCSAADSRAQTATCGFTVTVNDGEAPVINCPPDLTVQCLRDVPAPNFTGSVSDNCDSHPVVTHVGDVAAGTNPTHIARTYRATDASGNMDTCTQTITVQGLIGDLNGDCCVDRTDLNLLLDKIRARSTDLTYDLNGDGKVDIADARFLVLHFTNQGGVSCATPQ